MSNIKFSPSLFLEAAELNRFKKFLVNDGFRKHLLDDSYAFGLLKSKQDEDFSNFRIFLGTNPNTIKLSQKSYALDGDGLLITKNPLDNISLGSLTIDAWYWIKISHTFSSVEEGVFSIDTSGNLTGSGSKLTEILRGQPNFPSRVKFINATSNVLEYDVVQVIDDENAVLSGVFSAESNLTLGVVGTFTPGSNPISGNKQIFQYDDCNFQFIAESVLNTPPSKTQDKEFFVARIKTDGSQVIVQDKRTEFYKTKADYNATYINKEINPLIGVESVKYDATLSTKDKNIVSIAWGFRSSNWTLDSTLNKITISGGLGGKFKDPSYFTDGDFDGYRIYAKNGSFYKIIQSTKTGSQINLILEGLNIDDFSPGDELIITPDVEDVQIKVLKDASDTNIELIDDIYDFPINQGIGKIFLLVPKSPIYKYNVQYRYKTIANYSQWTPLPSDTVGYYAEASFTSNGVLDVNPLNHVIKPYTTHATNGFIELTLNPNAYSNFASRIDTGDLFGVQTRTLNNASPVISLTVGTSYNYQIITGTITLTTDHIIDLKTTSARNGNSFVLNFQNNITFNSNTLKIVQDYVNSGDIGTLLFEFTDFEIEQAIAGNLLFECKFNGTNWILFKNVSLTDKYVAKYKESLDANTFTESGFTFWDGATPNAPSGDQYHVISSFLQPGFGFQIARKINVNGKLFHRLYNTVLGSWTTWKEILDIDDYVDIQNDLDLRALATDVTAALLLKANATQPAWVDFTAANVLSTISAASSYRKNTINQIELRGSFNVDITLGGDMSVYRLITTLPAGHRPYGEVCVVKQALYAGIASSNLVFPSVKILANGEVRLYPNVSDPAGNLTISIDGIIFPIA